MNKCSKDNQELSYYIKYGFYGGNIHRYEFCEGEKCQKFVDQLWEGNKGYVQLMEMHWEQTPLKNNQ